MTQPENPTAQEGQGGTEAAPAIPAATSAPDSPPAAPSAPTPQSPARVPAVENLHWFIQRIDNIQYGINVQVSWSDNSVDPAWYAGQVDLITVLPNKKGEAITSEQVMEHLRRRAETYIIPAYFDPPVEVDSDVSQLIGTEGMYGDLPPVRAYR